MSPFWEGSTPSLAVSFSNDVQARLDFASAPPLVRCFITLSALRAEFHPLSKLRRSTIQ